MNLRLRPLRIGDEHEAHAAHAELEADDFTFLLHVEDHDSWADYVAELARYRRGEGLPSGLVPATFLVAVVDGALVGRVSIRHELNEFLTNFAGHIGYGVRPLHRRRGYATEILRQALVVARAQGVDEVLVTCDEGNEASRAVIERIGGVLEDVRVGHDGVGKRRYWFV
jgi:predicted acetyltransferase